MCMSVYTRGMKRRINIILSEEAIKKADSTGNRSRYIEELLLNTTKPPTLTYGLIVQAARQAIQEEKDY